jgi:hypothetical protein
MAVPTIAWTKVLLNPLGFAGYALCLLFGLLSRMKSRGERRWFLPACVIAAGVALVGGIGLAYRNVQGQAAQAVAVPSSTPSPAAQQQNDHPQQSSTGEKSPNVQGVQGGDVNINYGATPSAGKPSPQPSQRPAQKPGNKPTQ